MKNANFKNDQFFILNKSDFSDSLEKIKKMINKSSSNGDSFEKVWIPETQVTGKIKKIDQNCFEKVNNIFKEDLLTAIERKTSLKNLELVAVRKNELSKDEMVKLHTDTEGYVLLIDISVSDSPFEGGDILFKKDNGEMVQLNVGENELLVAKCTNEHGVTRVTSGKRESLAFFARPRA